MLAEAPLHTAMATIAANSVRSATQKNDKEEACFLSDCRSDSMILANHPRNMCSPNKDQQKNLLPLHRKYLQTRHRKFSTPVPTILRKDRDFPASFSTSRTHSNPLRHHMSQNRKQAPNRPLQMPLSDWFAASIKVPLYSDG